MHGRKLCTGQKVLYSERVSKTVRTLLKHEELARSFTHFGFAGTYPEVSKVEQYTSSPQIKKPTGSIKKEPQKPKIKKETSATIMKKEKAAVEEEK